MDAALDQFLGILTEIDVEEQCQRRARFEVDINDGDQQQQVVLDHQNDSSLFNDASDRDSLSLPPIQSKRRRAIAQMHQLMHRPGAHGVNLVLRRCIMPRLLFAGFDRIVQPSNASIPTYLIELKNFAVDFLRERIAMNIVGEIDAIYRILQNICAKCPERGEYRDKVSATAIELLDAMPAKCRDDFIAFLDIFSLNSNTSYRMMAIELAPQLIVIRDDDRAETSANDAILLRMLLRRCNDKAPTVRTRALINIATMLRSATSVFGRRIIDVYANIADEFGDTDDDSDAGGGRANERNDAIILQMIDNRCNDEKVLVRKAAVQLLAALHRFLSDTAKTESLNMLQIRCLDVAVSVRKQSAESLTHLLIDGNDADADKCWLNGVLPLAIDRELSVQQLAWKLVQTAVFNRIEQNVDDVWSLLTMIEQHQDFRRYLLRALVHLAKEDMLNDGIVGVLQRKCTDPEKANAAWMLLAELATVYKVNPHVARIRWFTTVENDGALVGYIAKICAAGTKLIRVDDRIVLRDSIADRLNNFRIDVTNLNAVYYALNCLYDAIGEEATGKREMDEWNREFVGKCHDLLSNNIYMRFGTDEGPTNEQVIRAIASLGEALQYAPQLINDDMFNIVQLYVTSDVIQVQLSRCATAISTRAQMTTNDQPMNGDPTNDDDSHPPPPPPPQSINASIDRAVRAHAIIALGKLCIIDEMLAKRCVPVLVRQLQSNDDHIVRNNIVVVISDLCIRYTLLVDRYSATIATCLKDRSTLVRRQTLTLLTSLIKEQYLKWQGQLMYRFVSTLLDENQQIRDFAELCLVNVLLPQFPTMFFQHFIECLFYFNTVVHNSWEAANAASNDRDFEANKLFNLSGKQNEQRRLYLYRFMAKQFGDIQRFNVAAKISHDIFGTICESSTDFASENVQSLLLDALRVMLLPEMQITVQCGQQRDNDDVDDAPMHNHNADAPQSIKDAAKGAIDAVVRRAIVDNILPNIISLKIFLQTKRSPLLRETMVLIREMSRLHRKHLDEFLANDRVLKAEIEFDIKRLDQKETREVERKKATKLDPEKCNQPTNKSKKQRTLSKNNVNRPPPIVETNSPPPSSSSPIAASISPIHADQHRIDIDAGVPTKIDIDDQMDTTTNDQPMVIIDENESPTITTGRRLSRPPIRAISTPQFGHLPEVTFRLDVSALTPACQQTTPRGKCARSPKVQPIFEDE